MRFALGSAVVRSSSVSTLIDGDVGTAGCSSGFRAVVALCKNLLTVQLVTKMARDIASRTRRKYRIAEVEY